MLNAKSASRLPYLRQGLNLSSDLLDAFAAAAGQPRYFKKQGFATAAAKVAFDHCLEALDTDPIFFSARDAKLLFGGQRADLVFHRLLTQGLRDAEFF